MRASCGCRSAVRACVGAGLVLALSATPGLAQSAAGTGLGGQLTDTTGGALPGAAWWDRRPAGPNRRDACSTNQANQRQRTL